VTFNGSFRPSIKRERRNLFFALAITASVMVAEVVGGWLSHSLALVSDAGHMLVDVMAISLAWFAFRLSSRPATPKRSYGYYRAEILAALFNGMVLMLVSFYIFYQAYHRLSSPPQIKPVSMLLVATIGLAANLSGIWLLSGSRQSLNIKGAYFHMLGDTISSLGVIGAGLIILLTGWVMVDPIVSIGIGGIILVGAYRLMKEAVDILMESTPKGIELLEVLRAISAVEGVREVHDLHIWTITSGMPSLSAHLTMRESCSQTPERVLLAVRRLLKERFGIEHTTLQLEPPSLSCTVQEEEHNKEV